MLLSGLRFRRCFCNYYVGSILPSYLVGNPFFSGFSFGACFFLDAHVFFHFFLSESRYFY